MKRTVLKIAPHAIALLVFALPFIADAQQPGFVPLASYNTGKLAGIYGGGTGDFSSFINGLFRFALAVGALGAVLRLAYAGYLYMGQADMWSHKGEAKKIIGDVTLGLLLLLGIWLILNQINPDILKMNALQHITPVQQQGIQVQTQSGCSGYTDTGQCIPSTPAPATNPNDVFQCSGPGCDVYNPQPIGS